MTRDSLLSELREIERTLEGISPNASTYTKLKSREREIQDQLISLRSRAVSNVVHS